jgi:benzoate/toluate 1,2-dioxygenase beta subunit
MTSHAPSNHDIVLRRVEQFVYREARLADEHEYEEWEALWADDAVYWVPANGDHTDPLTSVSVIFDNRSRIGTRVRQLLTGKRHAQSPPSRLRRLVANVELMRHDGDELVVGANFLVYESRVRRGTLWAGRTEYHLRDTPGGLRLVRKDVRLVDNDRPLPTLGFLI